MSIFGAMRLPHSVVFGCGQRAVTGVTARRYGRRALVCTDAQLSGLAVFKDILESLKAAGVDSFVYDRTRPDLPVESVSECAEAAAGFKPDVVIGVGGGTCMDLAKLTALLLTHGGRLEDCYGENLVPGPVLPIIALPTTSGTGSEVTPVAVVGDTARNTKIGVSSPHLIPSAAICDAELTLSCPASVTAASGADALTHAIEAFTSAPRTPTASLTDRNVFVGKNVLSDNFALLAISHVWAALERACRDGHDVEARERMMLAALAAGCAFSTAGTAAAHAIQYPVGNDTHTPHGTGVATLLPYVMEYNRPSCVAEFATIARTIGIATDGASDEQLSHDVIEAVAGLLGRVGIPASLAELGLNVEQEKTTAERALLVKRLLDNNPRPIDIEAMRQITEAAYTGNRALLRS